MSFEDEYTGRAKKSNPLGPFMYVLGLFMAIALGGIAWAVHEPLRDVAVEQIPDLPQEGEDGFEEIGIAVGGVVFLSLLMLTGMMYAAFSPKPQKRVSERDLKREKELRDRERKAKKKRQFEMRKKEAEERKNRRS